MECIMGTMSLKASIESENLQSYDEHGIVANAILMFN